LAKSLYRPTAVKKAAYGFTNVADVHLEDGGDETIVHLRPRTAGAADETLIGQLVNEALDQDLRETIAAETSGIRDLVLAQAFSEVSVFHPELDDDGTD
jgi:His-Xaa-Ser system protein HxsD